MSRLGWHSQVGPALLRKFHLLKAKVIRQVLVWIQLREIPSRARKHECDQMKACVVTHFLVG